MPNNIQQGNTAQFVVEYFDSNGNTTVPSSGSLSISYLTTGNVYTTTTVNLTSNNSFFLGTWSSTGAALGLATWSLTGANSTGIQATGQLRIIDRVSSGE